MRALVIYESMYGNTRAIAQAIGEGLASQGVETAVEPVAEADPAKFDGVELLIVGGPTHAHGMSRVSTRQSAVDTADRKAALSLEGSASGPGVREWLDALPDLEIAAAAFDTRIDAPAILTGRAAKGIDRKLHDIGCRRTVEPESFLVTTENRLVDGEVDRARVWGSMLAGRRVTTG
ncbi:MAG TPA: flavodoxin family protein [Acidimicrobiia bacterium]|nr:flavodoxin family protein [Acidimicrobiia bacterium]